MQVHISMRQSRKRKKSQLDQVRMVRASACRLVSASTPFPLPVGPGPTPRFPPAIAEDGASFREPINDAPGQPKDSLQSSVILETISDTSALVLAPCGLKSETKIGIFFFSAAGRLSVTSSLFYLKKMQSAF